MVAVVRLPYLSRPTPLSLVSWDPVAAAGKAIDLGRRAGGMRDGRGGIEK